jgi:hypothetical protein
MTYHVIGPDGNRYGPADLATLNQWAAEGRVTPGTMLEDPSGARIAASSVPGLMFGPPQMSSPNEPYGGYPGPQYHQPIGDGGNSDVTAAWVLGALGLVCCCICSIVGIVMASKAKQKGHPNAQAALIFNIVVLILSTLGGIFYTIVSMNNPELRRFF